MLDDRQHVLAAERRRQEALVAVDIAVLDALFAQDLVHVHSTGLVHDKPALLRHIAANRAFVSIVRHDLLARIYTDTAVLTGGMTSRMRRSDGEIATLTGIVTQVLRREGPEWKFVSFQFTLAG